MGGHWGRVQPEVWLDDAGVLHLKGLGGVEPVCPECHEPIRLQVDLASFVVSYDQRMVHARCVWNPEVFYVQGALAGMAAATDETAQGS
jgi:hypothetical protein